MSEARIMSGIEPAMSLVADPPWRHGDKLPGPKRGAASHYETMSETELCRMELPPLADDCWLWMWRLHTHHAEAVNIAKVWGFNPKPCSELVWIKQTKNGARVRMGMGHSLRMAHEVCLLFKRGRPKKADAGVPSVILAPRLEHSRKPDEFYRVVDRFVGDVPRVELFARRQWPDWTCLGDQAPELEAAQ